MSEIITPASEEGRRQYRDSLPTASKFLMSDGSIITKPPAPDSEIIIPASEEGKQQYERTEPITSKYLRPDGSVDSGV